MKKMFAVLAITLMAYSYSFAQQAPVPRTEEYCEFRTTTRMFRSKTVAHVDFGNGDELLKDANGKTLEFNSSVGVLNFMNTLGWELMNVRISIDDGDSFTYYVLKRKFE